MSAWCGIACSVVNEMKKNKVLQLPWDCEALDYLYCYKMDNQIVALIRLSQIPEDNDVVWIDEFEVLQEYRNQGIGKMVIQQFLEEIDSPITLMAKNKSVAKFWQKCGFEYEIDELNEIKMFFSR